MESFTFTPEALETIRTFTAEEVAAFKNVLGSMSRARTVRSRYESIGVSIAGAALMLFAFAIIGLVVYASIQYPVTTNNDPPAPFFSLQMFAELGIGVMMCMAFIGLVAGFVWCCARLACTIRRDEIRTAYQHAARAIEDVWRDHSRVFGFTIQYDEKLALETKKWLYRYKLLTAWEMLELVTDRTIY